MTGGRCVGYRVDLVTAFSQYEKHCIRVVVDGREPMTVCGQREKHCIHEVDDDRELILRYTICNGGRIL